MESLKAIGGAHCDHEPLPGQNPREKEAEADEEEESRAVVCARWFIESPQITS